MDVSTGPVVPKDLRQAIQAELLEMRAKGATQGDIAARVEMSQGMVSKAMARGELGQDFANAFLRAYRHGDGEKLVAKHGTRVTAGDVVRQIRRLPALEEAILGNSGRWPADALVRLVASLKKSPTLARPDGMPTRGTWEAMLDEAAEGHEPVVVGGVQRFREQLPRSPIPPKGV